MANLGGSTSRADEKVYFFIRTVISLNSSSLSDHVALILRSSAVPTQRSGTLYANTTQPRSVNGALRRSRYVAVLFVY